MSRQSYQGITDQIGVHERLLEPLHEQALATRRATAIEQAVETVGLAEVVDGRQDVEGATALLADAHEVAQLERLHLERVQEAGVIQQAQVADHRCQAANRLRALLFGQLEDRVLVIELRFADQPPQSVVHVLAGKLRLLHLRDEQARALRRILERDHFRPRIVGWHETLSAVQLEQGRAQVRQLLVAVERFLKSTDHDDAVVKITKTQVNSLNIRSVDDLQICEPAYVIFVCLLNVQCQHAVGGRQVDIAEEDVVVFFQIARGGLQ